MLSKLVFCDIGGKIIFFFGINSIAELFLFIFLLWPFFFFFLLLIFSSFGSFFIISSSELSKSIKIFLSFSSNSKLLTSKSSSLFQEIIFFLSYSSFLLISNNSSFFLSNSFFKSTNLSAYLKLYFLSKSLHNLSFLTFFSYF